MAADEHARALRDGVGDVGLDELELPRKVIAPTSTVPAPPPGALAQRATFAATRATNSS